MQATRNPNRMQEAVDLLLEKFQDNAAVSITYVRGENTLATGIRATVGRTPYEVIEGVIVTAVETRDYLLAKVDIGTEPIGGDIIIEEESGQKYQVSVPKPNYVYEAIGPNGNVYRIHTVGIK
jgi:hypothetical protein